MNSRNPLGIKVIGNYGKWAGLISVFLGIVGLLPIESPRILEMLEQQNMTASDYKIKAIWFMLYGIAMFVLGNGLLQLKIWARKGTIAFDILGIIIGLVSFFGTGVFLPKGMTGTVSGTIISGIIIYYLVRPEIKTLFKETGLKGMFWF